MGISSDEALLKAAERQPELLLYDYFKHMTTLSLAALGGIISIPQLSALHYPVSNLIAAIVLMVLTGAGAFTGMEGVIAARMKDEPLSRMTRYSRQLCGVTFGVGIGAFLAPLINLPR